MKGVTLMALNYLSMLVVFAGAVFASALIRPVKYRPYPYTKEYPDPRDEIFHKYYYLVR